MFDKTVSHLIGQIQAAAVILKHINNPQTLFIMRKPVWHEFV